jgi:hypothetical protein
MREDKLRHKLPKLDLPKKKYLVTNDQRELLPCLCPMLDRSWREPIPRGTVLMNLA